MNAYQQNVDRTTEKARQTIVTAYLNVWNMDCPDCVQILRNHLIKMCGMQTVDVLYRQGIVVAVYNPRLVKVDNVLNAIQELGRHTAHFYGAEVIGYDPAPTCSPASPIHAEVTHL